MDRTSDIAWCKDRHAPRRHAVAQRLTQRESELVRLPASINGLGQAGVFGWEEREREMRWQATAIRRLGLPVHCFDLAQTLFASLLQRRRVPSRYGNMLATACVWIAKKLEEDDSERARSFLRRLALPYTEAELKRMELLVLDVMEWDAHRPTTCRFLEVLCELGPCAVSMEALRSHLEALLVQGTVTSHFYPSVVAVAVMSLVVAAAKANWTSTVQPWIKLLDVRLGDVVRCRAAIESVWTRYLACSAGLSSYHLLSVDGEEDTGRDQSRDSDDWTDDDDDEEENEQGRPARVWDLIRSRGSCSPQSPRKKNGRLGLAWMLKRSLHEVNKVA